MALRRDERAGNNHETLPIGFGFMLFGTHLMHEQPCFLDLDRIGAGLFSDLEYGTPEASELVI
jgi:hypothetical protein